MPNILSELIENKLDTLEVSKIRGGYVRGDPRMSLFNGVILQALLDICREEDCFDGDREEAMEWFFSSIVSIKENFESVCDLAGVEMPRVKAFAYRIVNSDNKKTIRRQISYYLHDES
tara:strand:- start:1009 stop:1362 length:354 start_codon:yes stop_codon:yes gene_type:complete